MRKPKAKSRRLYFIDINNPQIYVINIAHDRVGGLSECKRWYLVDKTSVNPRTGYVSFDYAKDALTEVYLKRLLRSQKQLEICKSIKRALK